MQYNYRYSSLWVCALGLSHLPTLHTKHKFTFYTQCAGPAGHILCTTFLLDIYGHAGFPIGILYMTDVQGLIQHFGKEGCTKVVGIYGIGEAGDILHISGLKFLIQSGFMHNV